MGSWTEAGTMKDPLPQLRDKMPLWFGCEIADKGELAVTPLNYTGRGAIDGACLAYVDLLRKCLSESHAAEYQARAKEAITQEQIKADLDIVKALEIWEKSPGLYANMLLCGPIAQYAFRGKDEAFAYMGEAVGLARMLSAQHSEYSALQLVPFVTVLMHSEEIADLRTATALCDRISNDLGSSHVITKYLQKEVQLRKDIVDQFGRFPQRNRALHRKASAKELSWLWNFSSLPAFVQSEYRPVTAPSKSLYWGGGYWGGARNLADDSSSNGGRPVPRRRRPVR